MTEVDAVAQLVRDAIIKGEIIKSEDGREFLLYPNSLAKHEIGDPYKLPTTVPAYVKQQVTLQTVDSLVEYSKRFKSNASVLFADITGSAIAAVLDYHPAGGDQKGGRGAHAATLTLPHSEEWNTWSKASGVLKGQREFAEFLEENGGDIVAPEPAEVLEAARDLQAVRNVNFTKAVRTESFNENFEYSDETNLSRKGGVEVPTKFKLMIPVYFGEQTTELYAFLRWHLEGPTLKLGIKLHRAEHVRQAVFRQIVLRVGDGTNCPVVFGKRA